MSAILDQIVDRYARQLELRYESTFRWLTTKERDELTRIDTELHKPGGLWARRQYELAGASEAARLAADLAMKSAGQTNRNDSRRLV